MNNEETTNPNESQKLTLAQNVALTVKILMGFGLIGGALWAISLWTAVE